MTLRTGKIRGDKAPHPGGFTLIELMLVMALLTIVFALALPSLSSFFHGRTLDSEARRFLSLTRYGQSRAVSEGIPMVLWMDAESGSYGLEQDPGYSDVDPKAVQFDLDDKLSLEVEEATTPSGYGAAGRMASSRTGLSAPSALSAQPARTANGLPAIRFLPDGFVSDSSPEGVWLYESGAMRDNHTIWIALSRNGLKYEIQTNELQNARR
jgi:prepilin-type N-terminal cleavage/methylation domain-containing protein